MIPDESREQRLVVRFERAGIATSQAAFRRFCREFLDHCLNSLKIPGASLTVLFCSKARIRRLNRDYLGIDRETDVLSFPAIDDPSLLRKMENPYLGDIAICPLYCAERAKEAGNPLERELALMLVHGLLHLLGYDHDTPKRKEMMWKVQGELLEQGLDRISPPEVRIKS